MLKKLSLTILSVSLVVIFMFSFKAEAVDPPLRVERGGTAIYSVGEGYFVVGGAALNTTVASSSMTMNMLTGTVTIGEIVINARTDGDLTVGGNVAVGTSTPVENLVIAGTGTTTLLLDSKGAYGGNIVFRDSDGGGCTRIQILDGATTTDVEVCPD